MKDIIFTLLKIIVISTVLLLGMTILMKISLLVDDRPVMCNQLQEMLNNNPNATIAVDRVLECKQVGVNIYIAIT